MFASAILSETVLSRFACALMPETAVFMLPKNAHGSTFKVWEHAM
ncbi:hypothetical protein RLPCCGM1_p1042 [Rhizobium leguminosarum bv. phaseoli CCGM1]|nr:hypothetical protein RLPCCGM1_p1042 [Rhizobium leguminosarum bv. phaseoli CCGM1]